jgi:hypothetical protein
MAQQRSPAVSPTISGAGLSKDKIMLQFHILQSGGAIDFTTKNSRDISTRDSIRAYGQALQENLRKAQFNLLFEIVAGDPEFVDWMKKNNVVSFSVTELSSGIRLDISTSSQPARTMIHEFIRRARGNTPFTIEEKGMNFPGRDLGRDAPLRSPRK